MWHIFRLRRWVVLRDVINAYRQIFAAEHGLLEYSGFACIVPGERNGAQKKSRAASVVLCSSCEESRTNWWKLRTATQIYFQCFKIATAKCIRNLGGNESKRKINKTAGTKSVVYLKIIRPSIQVNANCHNVIHDRMFGLFLLSMLHPLTLPSFPYDGDGPDRANIEQNRRSASITRRERETIFKRFLKAPGKRCNGFSTAVRMRVNIDSIPPGEEPFLLIVSDERCGFIEALFVEHRREMSPRVAQV